MTESPNFVMAVIIFLVDVPFLLVLQSSIRDESDLRMPKTLSACLIDAGPHVVSSGCMIGFTCFLPIV